MSHHLSHVHITIHCHCPLVCLSFLPHFLLFLFLYLSICSLSLCLSPILRLSFLFSFLFVSFCLLSMSLMVAVGFLVYTQRFFLSIILSLLVFFRCLTQHVPGIQHLFSSLSLGDRYSNRRVQNQRSWSNTRCISHSMCKEYTILFLRIRTLLPECKKQCWCMSTGHT